MGTQVQHPGARRIDFGALVYDQFPAYQTDQYTKQSGLTQTHDMTVTVTQNGVVQSTPVTISEIATSGEYLVTFTPSGLGFWQVEVRVSAQTLTWKANYDVVAPGGLLPGQTFQDRVTDIAGNGVAYVLVTVLASGTNTVLYTTQTLYDGTYTVPLTGPLATNPLVDIQFQGPNIQTFTKTALRLG